MWRGLIGVLFVVAAIGSFVGARYAPEATIMYILIDLGCAALAGAVATQVPSAAAFFYSYIAVLVVTLGVNGFFVLAASLAIASALVFRLPLSCQRKHEPAPEPDRMARCPALMLWTAPPRLRPLADPVLQASPVRHASMARSL